MTKLLTISLDKLVALRRNPQYLTEAQMEGLKSSIQRDGFLAPIVVRKRPRDTFEILSGNHRVMAVRELNHKEIACVLIHPCTDAQAARIAMNMNTVHGDPNVELIAPFLSTLDDITLKEIFLPDSILADIKSFDQTLKERLAGFEVPDSLNSESVGNIPNCVCSCGHRHVARTS